MSTPTSTKWTVSAALLSKRKQPVAPPPSDLYAEWTLDQLRLECTSRKLNVKKNTCKDDRVKLLTAYDENKTSVELLLQRQRSSSRRVEEEETRRTRNCMFRLLNVLFSERFFQAFLASGNQLSRSELDQGGSTFWRDIAAAFDALDIEFDSVISDDAVFDDVDPSQTMAHSAAKLQRMWREVAGKFARAEAGSKKSGDNSNDFWDFCDGRADVYYLHLWCEHRGSGREFCAANLYADNEDDSQKEGMHQGKTVNRKRRKTSQADALATLADSVAQIVASEITKAQEETWKEQALLLRDQRVAHKLEMLAGILQRTKEEVSRLLQVVRSRTDASSDNEDEVDAENL
ncbi:hypothetical protein PF011_g14021 [Phytophthora fragariae]|uniref:Uncharacterized protein n=8 Tax=Phytophthora fragariae TaxID=53985 RepID=A0A6A3K143_9STRA|nr:hypothetical protein PF003_g23022 [Phytophthora fragariae]KAE9000811.1 hypothetical protein PF011_g14021 [Phytophthora fragariae]KAE9334054.1 hypothetical protein PF008_g14155 [Phytophthora fragariae]